MTQSQFEELPELLRRKQVLSILGVSKTTFYNLSSIGKIPVFKLPGMKETRVPKRSLLKLLGLLPS